MIMLFISVVLIVIVIALAWRMFFGSANAPLPRAQVTIQSSSTSAGDVATSSGTLTIASSSIVAGENGQLATTSLSIDNVIIDVELASTMMQQANGLSYRPSLGVDQGMLFTFGSGSVQTFWMKSMNFPLDMIWISGNTVVGIAQDVPAPAPGTPLWSLKIYTSPANTDKVLEVNAGTAAKYNIKVGDAMTIE